MASSRAALSTLTAEIFHIVFGATKCGRTCSAASGEVSGTHRLTFLAPTPSGRSDPPNSTGTPKSPGEPGPIANVSEAPLTAHPTGAWVVQQARNMAFELCERAQTVRFLLRDRDTKFTSSFDEVLHAAGIRIIRTPVPRSAGPTASPSNSLALSDGFVDHYNSHRTHRLLGQLPPQPHAALARRPPAFGPSRLRRSDRLGGLIREYHLVA